MIKAPSLRYPKDAKSTGIEGSVKLRLFVAADGGLVPRKDPECRWSTLSPDERREASFDKKWCVEAVSGPEALVLDAVRDYAKGVRFEPATDEDGTPVRAYLDKDVVYELN